MLRERHPTIRRRTIAWSVGFLFCMVAFAIQFNVGATDTLAASNSVFGGRAPVSETECVSAFHVEVLWSTSSASYHLVFDLCRDASSSGDFTTSVTVGDNDLELTYTQSSWTGHSTHFYEFELLRSETSSGTYGEYEDNSDRASPLDFDDVHTGYYYRARGKRCASAGTSCGAWSTLSARLNVPVKTTYTAPTLSTPTVSGDSDDMTVAFGKSTVSALRTHHYVVELHRADSASATFALSATVTEDSTPATFEGIDRSKVYKARAKRCETEDGKVCGPWSSFTSVWDAPSPPSGVTVSLAAPNTLSATYTRSTVPTASTHRYQFKLIRSEAAGGTYVDYGNVINTTSTVSFGAVHTGYHYRAIGRRCRTASSDCGEWSSRTAPTAVNVPVTTATPPSVGSTTLSTQGDDVTVNISTGSSSGPSGQAADPDPNPVPSYYTVELRRSSASSGTYSFYASASASASSTTFSDVETGWYYKARARACAATVRKLCGSWSPLSTPLNVPMPTIPALVAPTIAVASTGTIRATYTPASATYYYRLTLRWSLVGKEYVDLPDPALLPHGITSHTFVGLMPDRGGYYMAVVHACTDAKRRTCGSGATSNVVSLPTIKISDSTLTDVIEGSTLTVAVEAANFDASSRYRVVISVSNNGDNAEVLKLSACDVKANPAQSDPKIIGSRASGAAVTGQISITLHGCYGGRDKITAKLILNSVEHAVDTHPVNTIGIPRNLLVNGHSTSKTVGKARIRWEDGTEDVTRYEYEYGLHENPVGTFLDEGDMTWIGTFTAGTSKEATTHAVGINQLYAVRVRTVKGTNYSPWSELAFVYSTNLQPEIVVGDEPKVASIPLYGYWDSKHYHYTICTDTLPSGSDGQKWMNYIKSGISQWEETIDWQIGDSNIIRSTASYYSKCGSSFLLSQLTTRKTEVKRLSRMATNDACEVEGALGCAITNQVARDKAYIVFRSEDSDHDDFSWELNMNPMCSKLHTVAVHEAGHIFGLDHTDNVNSAMNTLECRPTPYDIAAIFAIYQSPVAP